MRPSITILIMLFNFNQQVLCKSALTFDPGHDRFGDQLMAYIRAKWTAKQYNLDLFVPHFKHSDQLILGQKELRYNESTQRMFQQIKKIQKTSSIKRDKAILYKTNFNINIEGIHNFNEFYYACKKNTEFSKELECLIAPIKKIDLISFLPDAVKVAVHVRKGGDFDPPLLTEQKEAVSKGVFADKIWPTKFPPEDFYLEALKYLSKHHGNRKLHVYISTDAKNPEKIANRFSEALNSSQFTFSYRSKNTTSDDHVLQDLFTIAQCDCLIRPQSSFSRVAQLIGDHKIIISPFKALWKGNKLYITDVSIIIN